MCENENKQENLVEEELVVEDIESIEEIDNEKELEKAKKLKRNYLKIFIQLILSSLVYLVASSCDKFKGLSSANDVQNMVVLEYAKYVDLSRFLPISKGTAIKAVPYKVS